MKIQIEECKEKACAVMIYMGTYIRDRKEGKYNDYFTYDGNPNADYKSYINLRTEEVYNMDLDGCNKFESQHIIIRIPVISNSYDSYLSNYMKIRKWFLEQLKVRKEEDIIEEIKQKYEKKIKIEELRRIRENITNLEYELSKIGEKKEKLQNKIQIIRDSCNHKVVVKTQKHDFEDDHFDRATCLMCHQKYSSMVFYKFDDEFENIIYFDDAGFDNLTGEEKVELAFNMFEEERKNNPMLSDSKIVEIINDRIKNTKGKTLSNKPDTLN